MQPVIVKGKVNVTLDTIEKVARALNVDVEELFILPWINQKAIKELVDVVGEIIKKKNRKSVKKLNLSIKEILH